MKGEEIIKANNILEKLDFFNQRSARKLWGDKPFDVQSQDIADRHKDIEYLKSFIEFQNKEIEKLRQAFEIAVKEQDIIQEQKDFECKKAVSKFVIELKSKIVEEIKNTNEQLQEIYDRDILMSGEGEIQTFHTVINIIDNLLKDWYGDKK